MYLGRILLKELVSIIEVYKKNVDTSTRFLINNNERKYRLKNILKTRGIENNTLSLSKPEPPKIKILLLFSVLKNRKVIYI